MDASDGVAAIYGALSQVAAAVGPVGKEQGHSGDRTGSWSYRSADDVVNAVHPALVAAGVVCVPSVVDHRRYEVGNQQTIELVVEYTFVAVSDGSSVTTRVVSHGMGSTAYATGAAMSYALKYALSQLLMIPFDDPKLDLESTEYRRAGDGEGAGPGRFAEQGQVAALYALIRAQPDRFVTRFKAEAASRERQGYSWSFADRHRWTQREWVDASAWVMGALQVDPWDDVSPEDLDRAREAVSGAAATAARQGPSPDPEAAAPDTVDPTRLSPEEVAAQWRWVLDKGRQDAATSWRWLFGQLRELRPDAEGVPDSLDALAADEVWRAEALDILEARALAAAEGED